MSLIANDVDTSMSRLRLVNTNTSSQLTTLQEKFVKGVEGYSCVVKSFYSNAVPPMFSEDFTLLEIFPKNDEQKDYEEEWAAGAPNAPAHFLAVESRHRLRIVREHHHDMLAFVQYISAWLDEFNRSLTLWGSNFGANNIYHIDGGNGYDGTQIANVVDATTFVGFFIDAAGRCHFYGSDEFFSQFFIKLDASFADMVGLPRILWAGTSLAGGHLRYAGQLLPPNNEPASIFLTGVPDEFQYLINASNFGRGFTFASTRPIYLADERDFLLLEMSLPFSRTVSSRDGIHTEKYRLAEFPIDNYIQISGTAKNIDGQMQVKVLTTDTLQGGLIDFTRGFPESHVIHFLPGDIQAINTRISCNYKKFNGTEKELPFLVDGFWDLELLFMKKVS